MFEDCWHLVGHKSEVSQLGDYFVVPLFDDEIVVYNQNGFITASSNACPHMGARLFPLWRGNKPDFKCNYHGRSDPPKYYCICETMGWIFVATKIFTENTLPLGIGVIGEHIGKLWTETTLTINARWEVCVENALETNHVPHVHRGSFHEFRLFNKQENLYSSRCSLLNAQISPKKSSQFAKLKNLFNMTPFIGNDYLHVSFYPHAMISAMGDMFASMQLYYPHPLLKDKTLFFNKLYALKREVPVSYGKFLDEVSKFNARVFIEDADICEQVIHYDVNAKAEEKRIQHFRSFALRERGLRKTAEAL